MLRHKPTGDIFVYTDLLAKRDDTEVFEQFEAEAEVVEEKPKPRRRRAPAKKKAKTAEEKLAADIGS
jgi:hypothetical protein